MFLALFVATMTACAKRLPISLVPKQPVIALVRNDMVNGRGRCRAHGAMRMHGKESRAGFLPFARIATLTGRGALAVVTRFTSAGAGSLTGATLAGGNYAAATTMTWRGERHGLGPALNFSFKGMKASTIKLGIKAGGFNFRELFWRIG